MCRFLVLLALALASTTTDAQSLIQNIGGAGASLVVNPRSNKIFGVNSGGGSVVVHDGFTHASTNIAFPAGAIPQTLAVDVLANRVYVARAGDNLVSILDGDSGAILDTRALGRGPIAVDSVRHRIYVLTGGSLNVADGDGNLITTVAGVSGNEIALDPLANRVFVGYEDGGQVHVVDGASFAVQSLAVAFPHGVSVNPITHLAYAIRGSDDMLVEIDGATLATHDIPLGVFPYDLAIDPVANKIYVVNHELNANPGTVTAIDGATRATTTINVGVQPSSIAIDASSNRVYVSQRAASSVAVIDGATNAVITSVALGSGNFADNLAVNPVLGRVYVGINSGLGVIDTATYVTSTLVPAQNVYDMEFDPVRGRVALVDGSQMVFVDAQTGAATPVPLTGGAYSIAADPAHQRFYATGASGAINLVDGTTLAVTPIATGSAPADVVVDVARDRAFVANVTSKTVSVIDGASATKLTDIPFAVSPVALALNSETGDVYVSHSNSNTVSVIRGDTLAATPVTFTVQAQQVAVNPITNKAYVTLLNVAKAAVIDGATLAPTEFNIAASASSLAVDARRNQVLFGLAGFDTRLQVINGATLTGSTVNLSASPGRIVVDSINDRVLIATNVNFTTFGIAILRGPNRALLSRAIGANANYLALDPRDGRLFFANSDLNVLTPCAPQRPGVPTTTIGGPAGQLTTSANATLSFAATSTYAPSNTTPTAVAFRADYDAQAFATSLGGGQFQGSLSGLRRGVHVVQAYPLDALGATLSGIASNGVGVHLGWNLPGQASTYVISRVEPTSRPTTTAITGATPASTVVGEPYAVSFSVGASSGTPVGNVTVSDGSASCQGALSGGSGTCQLSSSSAGNKSLVASYAGSGVFEPSTSPGFAHAVGAAPTAIAIVADAPDPSLPGAVVSVQFAVTVSAPGGGVPAGTVTVAASPSGTQCSASVAAGACSLVLASPGTEFLTASYSGSVDHAASTSSSESHAVDAGADLTLTIDDGVASVTAGRSTTYAIAIANAGPNPVSGAAVSDTLPAALTGAAWTCSASGGASCVAGAPAGTAASGTGSIAASVDVPVGGALGYALTAQARSSATGTVGNAASIAASRPDPAPANNAASDVDAIQRVAEVSISKGNGCNVVYGGQTSVYDIVAANAGPSDAPSTNVRDFLPAQLSAATWTCTPSGGAACAASGSGDIDQLVDLPAGSSVVFELAALAAASPEATLTNTASLLLAAGIGQANTANDASSDTDRVVLYASSFENDCQ